MKVLPDDAIKRSARNLRMNWTTASWMVLFHLAAVAALFYFTWQAFWVALFLWWTSGSLGIGMGYHRLLTHRGYKTPKWFEYFLTLCGSLALQGGPIFWVATHRMHHQFSDKEGDPHSPVRGEWWAHMGWVMKGEAMHSDATILARYAPDLSRDAFHVWISKWHYVPVILLSLLLLAVGGMPFLMWGIFARTVFGLHCTWAVNSIGHTWGSQRFVTRDRSTNNLWVALLSFGEGWHNNHHAHPTSSRHGLAWYEVDFNWYTIRLLKNIGLVRNVCHVDLSWLPALPAQVHLLELHS